MIYPQTYEEKIGFDQVRSRLTALCLCPLGEGLVRDMTFSVSFDDIRRQWAGRASPTRTSSMSGHR